MPATYRVRIRTSDDAAPETAAVRLVALLPGQWSARLLDCSETVTLALTPPGSSSPDEVERVVDAVLAHAALRGWFRDGIVSNDAG